VIRFPFVKNTVLVAGVMMICETQGREMEAKITTNKPAPKVFQPLFFME